MSAVSLQLSAKLMSSGAAPEVSSLGRSSRGGGASRLVESPRHGSQTVQPMPASAFSASAVLEAGLLSILWHRLMGTAEAQGEGLPAMSSEVISNGMGANGGTPPATLVRIASAGMSAPELAADIESIFFQYASFAAPSGAGTAASSVSEASALLVTPLAWRRLMLDIGLVETAVARAGGGTGTTAAIACERQTELIFASCVRGAAARAGILPSQGECKGLTMETFAWALARLALFQAPAGLRRGHGLDGPEGIIAADDERGVALLLASLLALLAPAQRLRVTMGDAAGLLEAATVEVYSRGEEMLRDLFSHYATDARAPGANSEGPVLAPQALFRALSELGIAPGMVSHSLAFGALLAVNPAGTALTFPGFLEFIGRIADAAFAGLTAFPTTAQRLMELLQFMSLSPVYGRIASSERVRRAVAPRDYPRPTAHELLAHATSPGAHSRRVTPFFSAANAATGALSATATAAAAAAASGAAPATIATSTTYWLPSSNEAVSAPLGLTTRTTSSDIFSDSHREAAPSITNVGRAARSRAAAAVDALEAAASGGAIHDGTSVLNLLAGSGSIGDGGGGGGGGSRRIHSPNTPDSLASHTPRASAYEDDDNDEDNGESNLVQSPPPPPSNSRRSTEKRTETTRLPVSRSPSPRTLSPPLSVKVIARNATAAADADADADAEQELSAAEIPTPNRPTATSAAPRNLFDASVPKINIASPQPITFTAIAPRSSAGLLVSPALNGAAPDAPAGFVTEHLGVSSLAARAVADHLYGVPVRIPIPALGKTAAARARNALALGTSALVSATVTVVGGRLPACARSLSPRGFRSASAGGVLSPYAPMPPSARDGFDATHRLGRAFFVDPALADLLAAHYAPLLPRLKPIFLLYARLHDPLNAGILSREAFIGLLRDVDALDARVTPDLVDFQLGVMARDRAAVAASGDVVASKFTSANGGPSHAASFTMGTGGAATSSAARLAAATSAAIGALGSTLGPMGIRKLAAGVASSGGDESTALGGGGGGAGRLGLDLDDFLEALARVSELVRRAAQLDTVGTGTASTRGPVSPPVSPRSTNNLGLNFGLSSPGATPQSTLNKAIAFFGDLLARRVLPLLAIAAAEDAAGALAATPAVLAALDPHAPFLHRVFAWYVSNASVDVGDATSRVHGVARHSVGAALAGSGTRARGRGAAFGGPERSAGGAGGGRSGAAPTAPPPGSASDPRLSLAAFSSLVRDFELTPTLVSKADAAAAFCGAARRAGTAGALSDDANTRGACLETAPAFLREGPFLEALVRLALVGFGSASLAGELDSPAAKATALVAWMASSRAIHALEVADHSRGRTRGGARVLTASELAAGAAAPPPGVAGVRQTAPKNHSATLRAMATALQSPPPGGATEFLADESANASLDASMASASVARSIGSSTRLADRLNRDISRSMPSSARAEAGAWRGTYAALPSDAPADLVGASLSDLVADALVAVAAPRDYLRSTVLPRLAARAAVASPRAPPPAPQVPPPFIPPHAASGFVTTFVSPGPAATHSRSGSPTSSSPLATTGSAAAAVLRATRLDTTALSAHFSPERAAALGLLAARIEASAASAASADAGRSAREAELAAELRRGIAAAEAAAASAAAMSARGRHSTVAQPRFSGMRAAVNAASAAAEASQPPPPPPAAAVSSFISVPRAVSPRASPTPAHVGNVLAHALDRPSTLNAQALETNNGDFFHKGEMNYYARRTAARGARASHALALTLRPDVDRTAAAQLRADAAAAPPPPPSRVPLMPLLQPAPPRHAGAAATVIPGTGAALWHLMKGVGGGGGGGDMDVSSLSMLGGSSTKRRSPSSSPSPELSLEDLARGTADVLPPSFAAATTFSSSATQQQQPTPATLLRGDVVSAFFSTLRGHSSAGGGESGLRTWRGAAGGSAIEQPAASEAANAAALLPSHRAKTRALSARARARSLPRAPTSIRDAATLNAPLPPPPPPPHYASSTTASDIKDEHRRAYRVSVDANASPTNPSLPFTQPSNVAHDVAIARADELVDEALEQARVSAASATATAAATAAAAAAAAAVTTASTGLAESNLRAAPVMTAKLSREELWDYVTASNGLAARGRTSPQESGFERRGQDGHGQQLDRTAQRGNGSVSAVAPRFARRAGLRGMLEKRREPVVPAARRSGMSSSRTAHNHPPPRSAGTAERDRDADFDGFSVVLGGGGFPSSPALSFSLARPSPAMVPTSFSLARPSLVPSREQTREVYSSEAAITAATTAANTSGNNADFVRYLAVARAMFDAAPQSGGVSPDYAAAATAALAAGGLRNESPSRPGSSADFGVHRSAEEGGAYELDE